MNNEIKIGIISCELVPWFNKFEAIYSPEELDLYCEAEPEGYKYSNDQYELVSDGIYIFVLKSKLYTYARHCSLLDACDLECPLDVCDEKCYCLGNEFFEGNSVPYKIYEV